MRHPLGYPNWSRLQCRYQALRRLPSMARDRCALPHTYAEHFLAHNFEEGELHRTDGVQSLYCWV